jgi:RNA polymerase-binding transcription factor DksA
MTRAETECYRQRLLVLMNRIDLDRSDLKAEALHGSGIEISGGLSNVPLHLADLGSHDFEQRVNWTLVEKEEQIMEEINAALARIEQGVFGRCEKCGRAIARQRLQTIPYTRYCISCSRQSSED